MPGSCSDCCAHSSESGSILQNQTHDDLAPQLSVTHNEATTQEPGNVACCEGDQCGCDDACLAQLARAICADDDGKIHYNKQHDLEHCHDGSGTDCSTCYESDKTCKNESCKHIDNDDKSEKDSVVDKAMPSIPLSPSSAPGACDHVGLRRRARSDHKKHETEMPTQACGRHLSIAQSRYHDTLAAFGCICRAMLARGLRSCCTSEPGNKPPISKAVHQSSTKSRRSVDTCRDGCCESTSGAKHTSNISIKSRDRPGSKSSLSVDSCCGDSCCAPSIQSLRNGSGGDVEKNGGANLHVQPDSLEKGVGFPNQRAVLAVRGMTCTGCENKLIRTLRAMPFLSHIKTSLVLCRAEFDFDSTATELQAIIETIERRTGFSAELVTGTLKRELKLHVNESVIEKLMMTFPEGVDQIIQVDRRTVSVVHDPRVTGARAILEFYAEFSPVLAPEPRDLAITAGAKHIRTLAIRTACAWVLTIPVLVMAWAPLPAHPHAYDIASLVLATIVQTAIAGTFYKSAFTSLFFSRLIETDLLIVLSTTAAYVYSVIAFAFTMSGHPLQSGEFFETSTLLVTLITVGQLVTAFARQRAMEAISIRSLQQTRAILMSPDGQEQDIDIRLLQYEDRFKVGPDTAIITDGIVHSGHSEVNESMMTGEVLPVEKKIGSVVIAGTVNGPSTLVVEVTRLPGDNTISDIAGMVDDARFSRARVQDAVDKIARWFIPFVLLATVLTFVIWLAVGVAVRKQSRGEAAVTALTYAIAVLAISCPCAVVLAVPMVILVAGGLAAKLGLVFKAATTIESAKSITHVVFDKTGTLTQGRLSVVKSDFVEGSALDVRAAVSALVSSSKHPVAISVAAFLAPGADKSDVEDVEVITGKGVQGKLQGGVLRGGSARWLGLEDHPTVAPLIEHGLTVFCVQFNDDLVAAFGLEDDLRPETLSVVNTLRERGISVSILSGDHAAAVAKVATRLGIPTERVKSGCTPSDKQAYIAALTQQREMVLFCGDGTNDAIALAQADIGVQLHTGDGAGFAASSAADVVLTHPSLAGILTLLELSAAVSRRITVNFVWCFVYNSVAILFAAGAFVDARIAPAYAGLGEIVSVVPVVLVAWQLKWFKMST